jgi:hypothetical protein
MQDKSIEELITELQELRIRQTVIISEIQQVIREETEQNGHNEREANDVNVRAQGAAFGFSRGDRVRIKNKVKKPASAGPAWSESRERLATVTKIKVDQIHIRTDNGTETWRAPHNLQRLD